ncbi:MAG: YkgJ family cysteine cluster protein [Promethearchaeota archaeon]
MHCSKCGYCCLETEMPLTREDISRIHQQGYKKRTFVRKLGNLNVLKNVNGHCVFFQPETKMCKVYSIRPDGCKYYPILYIVDEQSCTVDEECPESSSWNAAEIRKRCRAVTQLARKLMKEADID